MAQSTHLVWIDLEMTGLNVQYDVILEIATIITDAQLTIIEEGPSLVIHHPKKTLDTMNEWCVTHHKISGLTDAVYTSTISTSEAEKHTLAFIQQYCAPHTAPLCGNSVWQDKIFLQKYMPHITDYLDYRIVDISSIKALLNRWYPKNPYILFTKADHHRALPDIRESIEELKHYREHFFIHYS